MIKSRSQDELCMSPVKTSTFEFPNVATSSTTGLTANSYEANSPPSSPKSKSGLFRSNSITTNQQEVLQLNEDSHTWKSTSKRKQNLHQNNQSFHFCFGKLNSYLWTENASEFRFKIIVMLLFLFILLTVILARYFHYYQLIEQAIHDQTYIYNDIKKITFLNHEGDNLLNLRYGRHIPDDIKAINCRSISSLKFCYDWKYRAHLSVSLARKKFNNSFGITETVTCYNFFWKAYQKHSSLKDCFEMSDAHWFGMGDIYNLEIPLNKMSVSERPFITSHDTSTKLSGSIIGRTWFSSKGVLISVPLNVPLFVSLNSTEEPNQLCFSAKKHYPYHMNDKSHYAHLEYSICLASSINTLQNYYFQQNIKSISGAKNEINQKSNEKEEQEIENMFLDRIIWSTNVNFLSNFTQQNVQSYVDKITNYGFGGIILLDSRWENLIGELKMNETLFNAPKALVSILHNKGFKIMLTVSPNVDLRSEIFINSDDYIVLDSYLKAPLLTKCSNNLEKICALINFTREENRNHFRSLITKQLLNHSTGLSVDGIFFQSLQSSLIPGHINNMAIDINPDAFIEQMNSVVKTLPTSVGISTSVDSKNYSGYVTLHPRESSWQGLQSIIPSVLSLNLIGYPLVNTGDVGGMNLYTKIKNETDYINKELYLRWLQVVIFLPVVQFAEPPGGSDLDVIKVAKRLLKLRSEHFVPKMKSALIEYNHQGSPIVRPMWWGQNESEAFVIEDQFMVGNEIVVAPIVEEGKTERDIYLPHGWWKDEILAQVIRGGKWMRKYQVPWDKVAYFIRTEPSSLPIT